MAERRPSRAFLMGCLLDILPGVATLHPITRKETLQTILRANCSPCYSPQGGNHSHHGLQRGKGANPKPPLSPQSNRSGAHCALIGVSSRALPARGGGFKTLSLPRISAQGHRSTLPDLASKPPETVIRGGGGLCQAQGLVPRGHSNRSLPASERSKNVCDSPQKLQKKDNRCRSRAANAPRPKSSEKRKTRTGLINCDNPPIWNK